MNSKTAASSAKKMPRWARRWKRLLLWGAIFLIVVFSLKFLLHLLLPRHYHASGQVLELQLKGGVFQSLYYCHTADPKGIVIVGTGDGGWSYWEEKTAEHLAQQGYAVGGWDCRKFADSRQYDQAQLVAGFNAVVEKVRESSQAADDVPIWFGGWSTGAEQSVAAAASPDRPKHLQGLWLAAPGKRGRYGLTTSDLLGQTPTGPDTFSLAELAESLNGLPLVQFVADLDPLDDTELLETYPGPKRRVDMGAVLHDMGGAGEKFQSELVKSLSWTLTQTPRIQTR